MHEFIFALTGIMTAFCQFLAIVVISIGIVKAVIIYVRDVLFGNRSAEAITEGRLEIGHSFSLGLAFLVGASIVNTTVAPTWNDIGQLASIITIRTVLNQLLLREIERRTEPAVPANMVEQSPVRWKLWQTRNPS